MTSRRPQICSSSGAKWTRLGWRSPDGSYGGYLVSWIGTQTDRYAAIVNHAGVCDFQTQFASDVTQGRPRSMGGELWDNIEGMDAWNPLRHAGGFTSPMLVLHGMKDYRGAIRTRPPDL